MLCNNFFSFQIQFHDPVFLILLILLPDHKHINSCFCKKLHNAAERKTDYKNMFMATLQRSAVSFRRQGSPGLVWDDKYVLGEDGTVQFREMRPWQSTRKPGSSAPWGSTAALPACTPRPIRNNSAFKCCGCYPLMRRSRQSRLPRNPNQENTNLSSLEIVPVPVPACWLLLPFTSLFPSPFIFLETNNPSYSS